MEGLFVYGKYLQAADLVTGLVKGYFLAVAIAVGRSP